MTNIIPHSLNILQPAPRFPRLNARHRGLIGTTAALALAMMLGAAGQAWGAYCPSNTISTGNVSSDVTLTCVTDSTGNHNYDYPAVSPGTSGTLGVPVILGGHVLTIGGGGKVDASGSNAFAVTANATSGNGLVITATNPTDVAVISSTTAGNGVYQVNSPNKGGNIAFTSGTLTMSARGVAFDIGGSAEGTTGTPVQYTFNGTTNMAVTSAGAVNTFFKLGTSTYVATIAQGGTVIIPQPASGTNSNIGYSIGDNAATAVRLILSGSAVLNTNGGTAIQSGTAAVNAIISGSANVTGTIILGTNPISGLIQSSSTAITGNVVMGNAAQITTITGTTGGVAGNIWGGPGVAGGNVFIGNGSTATTVAVDGTSSNITSINTNLVTVAPNATLTLSGSGTIAAGLIGVVGSFTQKGGTLTSTTGVSIAQGGTFTYIGGTLHGIVTGPVPTSLGNFIIGDGSSPTTVTVDGTSSNITSINTNLVTVAPNATLTLSGSGVNAARTIGVAGRFFQNGGTTIAASIDVVGQIIQTGGTIQGPLTALVPITLQSGGKFNYSGGQLNATVDGAVPTTGSDYVGTLNIGNGTATSVSFPAVDLVGATNGVNTIAVKGATWNTGGATVKADTITATNGTINGNLTLTSSLNATGGTYSTCQGDYPYKGYISLTVGSKLSGSLFLGTQDFLSIGGTAANPSNNVTGSIAGGTVNVYGSGITTEAYTLNNTINNSALIVKSMGTAAKTYLGTPIGGLTLNLGSGSSVSNVRSTSSALISCDSNVNNSGTLTIKGTQSSVPSLAFYGSSLINNGTINVTSSNSDGAQFTRSYLYNSSGSSFSVTSSAGDGLIFNVLKLENFGTVTVSGTNSGLRFSLNNATTANRQISNGWTGLGQYGTIAVTGGGILVDANRNPIILNHGSMNITGKTTIGNGGGLTYTMGVNQATTQTYNANTATDGTTYTANINDAGVITFTKQGATPPPVTQATLKIDDSTVAPAANALYVVATSDTVFNFPTTYGAATPIKSQLGNTYNVFAVNGKKTLIAVLSPSSSPTGANVLKGIKTLNPAAAKTIQDFLTSDGLTALLNSFNTVQTGGSTNSNILTNAIKDFLRLEGLKERVQGFLNFGTPEGSEGKVTSAGSSDYVTIGETGLKAWGKVMASDEEQKRIGSYQGYDLKTYGFTAGVTAILGQGKKVGFVVGYNESKDQEKVDSVTGLKIKTNVVGVYGHMSPQETWYLEGSVLLGLNSNTGTRLDFSNAIYNKKYRSYSSIGDARWGYSITKNDSPWTIKPYLATLLGCTYSPSYTETGGTLPVTVHKSTQYNAQFGFGANVSYALEVNENWRAVPEMTAQYMHEFNGRSRIIGATWIGVPLGIPTPTLGTNLVTLGASMKLKSRGGTNLTFDYSALLKNKYVGHTGFVKVSYEF